MTDVSNKQKGFAYGENVVLRPVVEDDLKELARLMAEDPSDTTPWTHQRLKKKFENKEEPGLWGKDSRHYSVLRKQGDIVGFIVEGKDSNSRVYWCRFHITDGLPDRSELGVDLLKAYLAFKRDWNDLLRMSFDVVRPEAQKIAMLEQAGFELELTQERKVLYLGQPEAQCTYTWFSEALKQAPGWDDPAVAD